MNTAARLVLYTLGFVLIVFSLSIIVLPILKVATPEAVSKSLDALIVAFVAVLARTGKDEVPGA